MQFRSFRHSPPFVRHASSSATAPGFHRRRDFAISGERSRSQAEVLAFALQPRATSLPAVGCSLRASAGSACCVPYGGGDSPRGAVSLCESRRDGERGKRLREGNSFPAVRAMLLLGLCRSLSEKPRERKLRTRGSRRIADNDRAGRE